MVGMVEISALAGSLKIASDLAKTMIGLRDTQAFQAKAIELQRVIIDAQGDAMTAMSAHSDLVDKIRALETKLTSFENWETDKKRYVLKDHGENRVKAYALKEGVDPPEEPHSICPDCYQQRKISIIQEVRKYPGMSTALQCNVCKWEAYSNGFWRSEYGTKRR